VILIAKHRAMRLVDCCLVTAVF